MLVRFWGTRGSIASPGPETVRYGGNTPCVEVRTADGVVIILDCGTGARKLGLSLAQAGPVRAHLFVGHTHSDHIQGLPFFVPAFLAGSQLTIYGPAGIDRSLPGAIGGQMEYTYFPVPMNDLPARLDFDELEEEEFFIDGVRVHTQYLNHTAPCLGYRIEADGATLVYATDHEPNSTSLWRPDRPAASFDPSHILHPNDARHAEFLRDADLVIHDAQYVSGEYRSKLGWGHSTVEYATDIAIAADVKHLALFHHDPTRTDDALDSLHEEVAARVAQADVDLQVYMASEGMELRLGEEHSSGTTSSSIVHLHGHRGARVLVAEDDDAVAYSLRDILLEEGHETLRAVDGAQALRMVREEHVDLVLLDLTMPEMDGFAVCRALRSEDRFKQLPILMLTAHDREDDVLAGFAAGATDYIAKPFSVAQLRTRVHLWVTRAMSGHVAV